MLLIYLFSDYILIINTQYRRGFADIVVDERVVTDGFHRRASSLKQALSKEHRELEPQIKAAKYHR